MIGSRLKPAHWLILIVILFLGLRIPFLNKEFVFEETFLVKSGIAIVERGYPEYYAGEQFTAPIVNVLKPPGFVMLLAGSYKIFGVSEFSSRLVPLLLNLGTLLLLFAFCKKFFPRNGTTAGLVATLLFAINPFFIQNSIQVDLDGGIVSFLLMLFVFISAQAFLKSSGPVFQDWFNIGTVFLISFGTKFEPSLMIAFTVFLWLILTRKSLKQIWSYLLTLAISVALFFLVFGLYNTAYGHADQTLVPILLITYIFNSFFIPRFQGTVIDAHKLKAWQESLALFSMYVVWVTPPFLLAAGLLLLRKTKAILREPAISILLLWFFVMAGTYFLFGNTGPGYPRYLAPASIPLFILFGYFLSEFLESAQFTRKLTLQTVGLAVIYAVVFAGAGGLLFLERKLLINLELLRDPAKLVAVAKLGAVWVGFFAVLFIATFIKKIGWSRVFAVAILGLVMTTPFAYAHDVLASYSLTNVYGQSGFLDAGVYLHVTLPENAIILTNDTIGFYYQRRYFDFAFSVTNPGSPDHQRLVDALSRGEIAAIALSTRQLEDVVADVKVAPYLSKFKLMHTFGNHKIFIRK